MGNFVKMLKCNMDGNYKFEIMGEKNLERR